jgi:uncharacterized protein (TIGR03546 family)
MLRAVAKLLKALNSESNPGQISLAFCLAMIAGFTPLLSLHNLLVLFLVLLLRVNLSAFLLGLGLFSGVAYLLDPLFHRLGLAVLTADPLLALWTGLYDITVFRLAYFNNSVVMGSLLVSLLLAVPLFVVSRVLIVKYREHVLVWVQKSRVLQILKGSKLYRVYHSVSGWRE